MVDRTEEDQERKYKERQSETLAILRAILRELQKLNGARP